MKRIAWLTDIHLNFLRPEAVETFLDAVASTAPDAVLLSGDIGEAHNVVEYLRQIAGQWACPVYFVLGNHDFYFGSIAAVRDEMKLLCEAHPSLHYLTQMGVTELSPGVGLVGHDGWADARLGDYLRSEVMLNDYRLIQELAGSDPLPELTMQEKQARWPLLRALGDQAADQVRSVLPAALEKYPHVFVVTHVPPFREACWHEGRLSNDEWLPHFSCQAVGKVLVDALRKRPDRRATVLCGHTHGQGEAHLLPNLHILTGGARYGAPAIQRMFELE